MFRLIENESGADLGALLGTPRQHIIDKAKARIRAHPLTTEMFTKYHVPAGRRAAFRECVAEFNGEVKDPNDFEIEMMVQRSGYGDVYLIAHYSSQGVELDLDIDAEDEDEEEELPEPEDLNFDRLWSPPLPRAETRRNTVRVPPNAKCPCGALKDNGQPKKHKRCCGS